MKCEDCKDTGYLLMDNDVHGLRIERCDACCRFQSDAEAQAHVYKRAELLPELVNALVGVLEEWKGGARWPDENEVKDEANETLKKANELL